MWSEADGVIAIPFFSPEFEEIKIDIVPKPQLTSIKKNDPYEFLQYQ